MLQQESAPQTTEKRHTWIDNASACAISSPPTNWRRQCNQDIEPTLSPYTVCHCEKMVKSEKNGRNCFPLWSTIRIDKSTVFNKNLFFCEYVKIPLTYEFLRIFLLSPTHSNLFRKSFCCDQEVMYSEPTKFFSRKPSQYVCFSNGFLQDFPHDMPLGTWKDQG